MKKLTVLVFILLVEVLFVSAQPNNDKIFWNSLQVICGKAFAGEIVHAPEDDSFRGKKLVMHVRSCEKNQIKIPFFVGEDRSRTWVLTKKNDRILLKHDHRHEDGKPDEVTMYGGVSSNSGSSVRQVFPADEETAKLIPAAISNVWWIDVDKTSFTYNLRRVGTDRYFSIKFDLTKTIATPEAPWGWEESSANNNSPDKMKELEAAIAKNEYERLSGVIVAKDGKLIYEKYYNGFDENSVHDTRSATKTVTAMLIGIAIDKGFIKSEKELIMQYFTDKKPFENPDQRKEKITIEDLLTMSSVVECSDDNPQSRGNEEKMYIIEDYHKFYLDLPIAGIPPWENPVKDLPYQRRFSYCTAGTVLLGGIIERSSKMKVSDFAKKYLFEPLGISDEKWQFIPMGTAMTGGGLRLKARDFIKLGQLYLDGGKFNAKQIISSDWIAKSIKPSVNTGSETDYGYLWWLPKYGQKDNRYSAYAMLGNGGNKVVVMPDLNLVIVLPNRMYGRREGHQQTEKIMNEYIVPTFAKK